MAERMNDEATLIKGRLADVRLLPWSCTGRKGYQPDPLQSSLRHAHNALHRGTTIRNYEARFDGPVGHSSCSSRVFRKDTYDDLPAACE